MPPRSRARNAPPSPPTQPSLADTVEDTEAAQPEVAQLPSALPPKAETACSKCDKKMVAEVLDFIKRRTLELEAD